MGQFAQGSVLGLEVLDDALLVPVDPAGNSEQEELQVQVHDGRDRGQGQAMGQVLGVRAAQRSIERLVVW